MSTSPFVIGGTVPTQPAPAPTPAAAPAPAPAAPFQLGGSQTAVPTKPLATTGEQMFHNWGPDYMYTQGPSPATIAPPPDQQRVRPTTSMTPQQQQNISSFFTQNIDNPQAVMDAMTQYGVGLSDLAAATGMPFHVLQSYLGAAGAPEGFGGGFNAPAASPGAPPPGTTTPGTGGNTTSGGGNLSLSEMLGPGYSDLLSNLTAWAKSPYERYTGDLTAGPNEQLTGAASGIAGLNLPPELQQALTGLLQQQQQGTANPYQTMQFSSRLPGTSASDPFAVGTIDDYMNPYIQQALDPQLREAQRNAELQRVQDQARLTKAGAYGGSRQALLQAENNRNSSQLQSDIMDKGYSSAYDRAMQQMMDSSKLSLQAQGLTDQSNQFGAKYGLDALNTNANVLGKVGDLSLGMGKFGLDKFGAMGDIGKTLWGIEQAGLTADYDQFKEERDDPMKKMMTLLGGYNSIPTAFNNTGQEQSSNTTNFLNSLTGLLSLFNQVGAKP